MKFKFTNIQIHKCIFVLFVICYLSFSFTVRAQSFDFTVNPPQAHIIMKPGASLTQAFDFGNSSDAAARYSFQIYSFKPQGDMGGRTFLPVLEGPVQFSLENADKALTTPFSLATQEKTQAVLKVSAPLSAKPGDYYYTLFLQSEPNVTQKTAGKGLGMIGANVLVSITSDGAFNAQPSFAQLQIIPDYVFTIFGSPIYIKDAGKAVPVVVEVANTAAYLFNPNVELTARGPYAYSQKRTFVPVSVLSQSQRLMTEELPPECAECTRPVSTVLPSGMWGKYTMTASIDIEGSHQKVYGSIVYWVLPMGLIAWVGIGFAIGCIVLIVLYIRKRRKGMKKN